MTAWELARSSGLAAFWLLSIATGAGAYTSRRSPDPARRLLWQYVHRASALSGLVLLLLHLLTLTADPHTSLGPAMLVPFQVNGVPGTLGVLSLYAILAGALTGILRRLFSTSTHTARRWRPLHLLTYTAWPCAAAHYLLAGTDTTPWWATLTLAGGTTTVTAGILLRLLTPRPAHPRKGLT